MMRKLIRQLLIGTISVLVLGIGGAALDYAADPGNAASMPATQTPQNALAGDPTLRTDDIRWVQVELRHRGLYNGSLDGILGPATKQALGRFQVDSGLGRTAALDAQTWKALTGHSAVGQGSSMAPAGDRAGASDLGR
jgi:peptidoglycan hydrolase-like protein with peptidoglycan-binding domain